MNITLTSLEALILKATNENLPCPDAAALEAFCAIMRDSAEGPQLAAQALATRLHTTNPKEALLTLSFLDRCMRKGDSNFQIEIGKFRFLNELIKLVSPKYLAERTAPEVRTRILQLFHAWSIEYPKVSKFKVAYDMLKNQGVITETPPPLPPEDVPPLCRNRPKSAIFEDEEKSKLLQKLLQSKKPEDLQHANRLIKTMVKEEERRSEANSRRAQEVTAALDSAGLLKDMLDRSDEATVDELQLIHELHASCQRMRPTLQHQALHMHDNLDDIVHASDTLDEVFEMYKAFLSEGKGRKPSEEADTLLDFAGASPAQGTESISELRDLFCTVPQNCAPISAELLKPVNSTSSGGDMMSTDTSNNKEAWIALDSLSEQLIRQSLPENTKRHESFDGKSNKKIPMNALEKSSPKHELKMSNSNSLLLDLDYLTKNTNGNNKVNQETPSSFSQDDAMVDLSGKPERPKSAYMLWLDSARESIKLKNPGLKITELARIGGEIWRNMEDKSVWEKKSAKAKEQYARQLADLAQTDCLVEDILERRGEHTHEEQLCDIEVDLESLSPVGAALELSGGAGVCLSLHVCRERPRPSVRVLVLTARNTCEHALHDLSFTATGTEGCEVWAAPASGRSLGAWRPWAPAAVTQPLLVRAPAAAAAAAFHYTVSFTAKGKPHEIRDRVELTLPD